MIKKIYCYILLYTVFCPKAQHPYILNYSGVGEVVRGWELAKEGLR